MIEAQPHQLMFPVADVYVLLEVVSEPLAVGVTEPGSAVRVALGTDRLSPHAVEDLALLGCCYSPFFALVADMVPASVFSDLYVAVILSDGPATNLAPEFLGARHVGDHTPPEKPSQVG